MSVLLLGATGYIGQAFIYEMARREIPFVALGRGVTDYTRQAVFSDVLKTLKPEIVINCSALVCKPSVDLNEEHRHETLRANSWLPLMLIQQCDEVGIPLAQISTGCLYNGDNDMKGWSEYDPSQLTFDKGAGVYVGSKDLAEKIVRLYEKYYLWRIRIPFDNIDNDRNYLSKLMRFDKVFTALNSLSHRGDFVSACLDLWRLRAPFGTYNVTNQGAVTAGWICTRINSLLMPKKEFKFWKDEEFMKTCAKTKKSNCVLSVRKLLDAGVRMRMVDEAINESLAKWIWDK